MTFENITTLRLRTQYITVNSIEPYDYMFFVSRTLTQEEAQNKKAQTSTDTINEDILKSLPLLTVYVHEINYPIVEFSMPISILLHVYNR